MQYLFKYPWDAFEGGEFVFLHRIPGEVILILMLLASGATWWMYRQVASKVKLNTRRGLLAMRVALLALIFILLCVPAIRRLESRESVFTAVLVDSSRSMSIADVHTAGTPVSRMEGARQLLSGGLAEALEADSKLALYHFATELRRAPSTENLRPDGNATDLFRPIRELESELRGVPLAAVVLLTDGCRNAGGAGEDAAKLLKSRNVPLYVVGLGDPDPPRDYEVVRVSSPRRVRRNTQVDIHATLRYTDLADRPFELQIRRANTVLHTQTINPSQHADMMRVRLTFTPDVEGTATYTVSIPVAEGEKITENNGREFVLEIRDDRLPVLYIEGSPRLEYRFLRRALFRDKEFRLVSVLRLAKDRFYVQGANASEEYLSAGFPTRPEQLYAFQGVILGDIEASYFTPKQLEMLEEFVSRRGGGLLMLGGVNSFGLGGYDKTAVAKLLPLEVSAEDGAYSDAEYQATTTEQGLLHPVMRLTEDAEVNRRLWEKAPPLKGITPVKGMKLGGRALLVRTGSRMPVLAVQNYGEGRVAAFTSGGSWYWQVSMPASDEFHERFWKQMTRWLAAGAKRRISVEADADVYARGDKAYLTATVLSKDLRPINDAQVIASVTDPVGNTEEVPMNWILSREGVYQCTYTCSDEGDYRVEVRVEGWAKDKGETDFKVSAPFVEFTNAGQKEELLRQMAAITGGAYYNVEDAGKIPPAVKENVKAARTAGIEPVDHEIWDMPINFLFLLLIAATEWVIRRKSGLA